MRKTRKQKAGNKYETGFKMYALKIRNKENINLDEFNNFLLSVKEPLKIEFDFDGNGNKYTINEYALLYDAGFDIHSIFCNYESDIFHKANYSSVLFKNYDLTILEAYLIQGNYIKNIKQILEQIGSIDDESVLVNTFFRYGSQNKVIPTVLLFAIESSIYKNSLIGDLAYQTIIEIYTYEGMYNALTANKNNIIIDELFLFAMMYKKLDFIVYIISNFKTAKEGLRLLFHQDTITQLLLHDDVCLYNTIIELISKIDTNLIKEILSGHINNTETHKEIIDYLKTNDIVVDINITKGFFEKIGKQMIKNVVFPYKDNKARIIIVCHGQTIDNTQTTIEFPFNKLCFFVEKGQILRNKCLVSRSIEELVCAGNYDNSLKCTESVDGKMKIDNMKFLFMGKTLMDVKNDNTGIYICNNKKVNKIYGLGLTGDKYFSMQNIIDICINLSIEMRLSINEIDLMFFVCRSYEQFPSEISTIEPNIITNISK